MILIRPEAPRDSAGVRRVNEQAFGQPAEADLVDALRPTAQTALSLVAELDGQVVGHILFTRVQLDSGESESTALALGPMAVLPEHQRRGVGSRLVQEGLEQCKHLGHDVVFVLGHPAYYPRFGFEPAPPKGITCAWDVPPEVFMVAELQPGALRSRRGLVRYAQEFSNV